MLPPSGLQRLITFLLALVVFAWMPIARADSACPILVEPLAASTTWHEKAREAESVLAKISSIQHDCRSVRIEVQPEGNALLTFTTTDGRIAVRLLHAPEDIPPTVEALLVTLPVETPINMPAAATINNAPQNPPAKQSPREQTSANLVASRAAPRILFDAFTGGRFGIDAGVFAPAIGIHATMLIAPWEMGLGGEWNPLYVPLTDSAPSGYLMRSFEANLFLGRRIVRESRAFHAGMNLGVAVVHEEVDADPAVIGRISLNAFQPRIGVYGGLVVPYDGTFRFRVGLQGDVALWGVRDAGAAKKNLPALPRFGLGIYLGMEVAP